MTEEQVFTEVERLRIVLEIGRETRECFDRLTEILNLLKVPECDSKYELIREIGELVDRIHELNLKLCDDEEIL